MDLTLLVLSYWDLKVTSPGFSLFLAHQIAKEVLATSNVLNSALNVGVYELCLWMQKKGAKKISPMNKGGTQTVGDVRVTMVHADHSCGIEDDGEIIYGGEPCGYVIEYENRLKIYHAGDTNVFGDMAIIRELYGPEIAMLPIGDHYTMGPREAAYAHRSRRTRGRWPRGVRCAVAQSAAGVLWPSGDFSMGSDLRGGFRVYRGGIHRRHRRRSSGGGDGRCARTRSHIRAHRGAVGQRRAVGERRRGRGEGRREGRARVCWTALEALSRGLVLVIRVALAVTDTAFDPALRLVLRRPSILEPINKRQVVGTGEEA